MIVLSLSLLDVAPRHKGNKEVNRFLRKFRSPVSRFHAHIFLTWIEQKPLRPPVEHPNSGCHRRIQRDTRVALLNVS